MKLVDTIKEIHIDFVDGEPMITKMISGTFRAGDLDKSDEEKDFYY